MEVCKGFEQDRDTRGGGNTGIFPSFSFIEPCMSIRSELTNVERTWLMDEPR
jgi:hypothetical protein